MKLTPKQKAFADYYIQTGNATEAAKKSGYKGKNLNRIASENLSKLDIKKYIDERMEQISSERIADAVEVLEYLTSVMRGKTTSEIVVVEGCGDGCSEARRMNKAPDERERLKAAELIGKRYAMWTDKLEANVQQQVVFTNEQELED